MKKLSLILIGVAMTVGVLATAGLVYAAVGNPTGTQTSDEMPFGPRMMPGSDFPGMFGGRSVGFLGNDWEGPLSDYMLPAIAGAFGLNNDQVDAFQVVKDTITSIKGDLTRDEIQQKMKEAIASAIDQALAEGAITQDEADQMLAKNEQSGERPPMVNFGGRGMRGDFPFGGREAGIFQQYMEPALAEALGVSVEELQSMKKEGLNLKDYAEEQGLTDEELHNLMVEVYTNALNAAVKDGAITQEQADRLLEAIQNFEGRIPFDLGFRAPRGNWNNGQ
jgi:hypothetical protein